MGAAVLVLFALRATYHLDSGERCTTCWAWVHLEEYGVCWSEDVRLPLKRTTTVAEDPPDSIRRFIAADHVHDSLVPVSIRNMTRFDGEHAHHCQYVQRDGGFARALIHEPEFAKFLDARIADGSLGVETVRELIAVTAPTHLDAPVDERLLAEGRKLYAAFHPRPDREVDVWSEF
jgi:hypothetical protein